MKPFLPVLAAVIAVISSSAFAAGEPGKSKRDRAQACTFDICHASAVSHGHSPSVAANWCNAHLKIGDACKNVGK